jgi:histidinol-phosphate aminotransferase
MAYASESIINILNKIKYPYNINIQTQELVLNALDNVDQKNKWVKEILTEREMLSTKLNGLAIVNRVFPSDANFILVRVEAAEKVYDYLMNLKIIVRDRSKVKLCDDCLRITVGTPKENEVLIKALADYQP